MKKILLITLLVLTTSLHAESFPNFPMALYGQAYINNVPATSDSIISAYYGNQIGGQVVVQSDGFYGYATSSSQKLTIAEGLGTITFKIRSQNQTANTEVISAQSYPAFESGTSTAIDLYFTYTAAVVPSGGSSSGSSGGGGGGGFSSNTSTVVNNSNTNSNTNISPVKTLSATAVENNVALVVNNKKDLQINAKGEDVRSLQKFLNNQGFILSAKGAGSKGLETTFFGPATKAALIKFQIKNKITPASGYFGPKTKAVIKVMLSKLAV